MNILLRNIRVSVGQGREEALNRAEKLLRSSGVRFDAGSLALHKISIDARKKNEIFYVASVSASVADGEKALSVPGACEYVRSVPSLVFGNEKTAYRPVVVGFGPAGMFCSLLLAENGYRPLVLERGSDVLTRKREVGEFLSSGKLNVNSNVQFGAGGAGTFSDGKLFTRVNDPLTSYVAERLYGFGAPESILTSSHPHIGTDKLLGVVGSVDKRISSLGGEIRYGTVYEGLERISGGYRIRTSGGDVFASCLVLAVGHSARDTYAGLAEHGFVLSKKPFSVGLRIEQSNEEITSSLYGKYADVLGSAEYSFSHREGNDAVYTFCMCPGGYVVASASEEGGTVTNGMSESARDGINSNCALCVSVSEEDYGSGLFDGMRFQQSLERAAFRAGGGRFFAPVQTVGDYINGRKSLDFGKVKPTYRNGEAVTPFELNSLFSSRINGMMKKGLALFEKKARGFAPPYAVLTGVESRTSSPLRIERDPITLESAAFASVYPCGEGAGYAGGIMSSALDGIKAALKIMGRFRPCDREID